MGITTITSISTSSRQEEATQGSRCGLSGHGGSANKWLAANGAEQDEQSGQDNNVLQARVWVSPNESNRKESGTVLLTTWLRCCLGQQGHGRERQDEKLSGKGAVVN